MPIGEQFEGIAEDAKKLPWWGWVILALVLFLVAQHFGLLGGGSSTSTPGSDTSAATDNNSGVPPTQPPPPEPVQGSNDNGGGDNGGGDNGGGTKSKKKTKTYTVRSGDTLSDIASHEGVSLSSLYSTNQGIIEATARQHGFSSSDHGHWIFPGERLVIPA